MHGFYQTPFKKASQEPETRWMLYCNCTKKSYSFSVGLSSFPQLNVAFLTLMALPVWQKHNRGAGNVLLTTAQLRTGWQWDLYLHILHFPFLLAWEAQPVGHKTGLFRVKITDCSFSYRLWPHRSGELKRCSASPCPGGAAPNMFSII